MIKNYLKIAFRNIARYKGYSFINIVGLAIGMACAILIFLWVQDDVNFDQFHENKDNLYCVSTKLLLSGKWNPSFGTPPAFGLALKKEYPEIRNSARMQNGENSLVVRYGEKMYTEEIRAGDFSLLEIFTFPLVKGDLASARNNPYSIFLTERMAEKYFQGEDPVGKVLSIDNKFDLTVAGVLKNMPENSMVRFDFLMPLEMVEKLYNRPNYTGTWYNLSFNTFVLLREGVSPERVSQKIEDRIIQGNGGDEQVKAFLCKYSEIYLYGLLGHGGRIKQILLFCFIALIILLIACINFMNLATARYANRAKEVGLRKVAGASRKNIIMQFFSESILISFISFIFAYLLASWLIPAFNSLTGKQLTLEISANWLIIAGAVGLFVFTGIIAGSYPAFFLSSFRPIKVLQGTLRAGSKASSFRKILVVVQFAASIVLIISTVVVFNQLKFVSQKNLGFEKERIVYLPLKGTFKQTYNACKQELLKIPGIRKITAAQSLLTGVYWNGHNWNWEGRDAETDPLVTYIYVDSDFIETFNMKMVKGRFFPAKFAFPETENSNTVVINEAFMRMMQTDNPVGQSIWHDDNKAYRIIGVVKDFHFKRLHVPIEPLIFFVNPDNYRYMYAKIRSGNIGETIKGIESVFKKLNPGYPFQYHFLDESFERLYRSEVRLGKIFQYFAILAVFISCLGLFGLASFMVEQRTREIGIRKALGLSETGIVLLLLKEFIKWVAAANVIAWPAAYFFMSNWLQNFAYRSGLGVGTFILSGLLTLVIAVLTVSFQSIKTAHANPVEALRYE